MGWIWKFPCTMRKNYDGDSITVVADLGFHTMRVVNLRLENVDTPEINQGSDLTKAAARFVRDEVRNFIDGAEDLVLVSGGVEGVYGRAVGDILVDGQKLEPMAARP